MKNGHISIDNLIVYLENPNADEHQALRQHLLSCQQCLLKTYELQRLEHILTANEQLSFSTDANALNKIRTQDTFSASSPFYQSNIRKNIQSTFFSLIHFFKAHKTQTSLGLSLALIFSLTTFFSFPPNSTERRVLATYQDSPHMTFSMPPSPGMGFYHTENVNRVPFNAATIQWQHDTLFLHWDSVSKALNYSVTIYLNQANQQNLVASVKTTANNIQIKNLIIEKNRNYHYQISGKTRKGLSFSTSGGFIF